MCKEELWQAYLDKNPKFLTEGGNFTAKGLRQFFDQTWTQAYKAGEDAERAKKSTFESIFGKGIFK